MYLSTNSPTVSLTKIKTDNTKYIMGIYFVVATAMFLFLLLITPALAGEGVFFRYPYGALPQESDSTQYQIVTDINEMYSAIELTNINQTLSSFQELVQALNPVNLLTDFNTTSVTDYFRFPTIDGIVFDNSTGTPVFSHAFAKKTFYADRHDKEWHYDPSKVYYERYQSSIFQTTIYGDSYDVDVIGYGHYTNAYCFLYSPPVSLEEACTAIPRCVGYIEGRDCLVSISSEDITDTTYHGQILHVKRTGRTRGIIAKIPGVVIFAVMAGLVTPYLSRFAIPMF